MPSKEDDDVLVVEEKPIGDEGGEEEEEKLSKEGIENDWFIQFVVIQMKKSLMIFLINMSELELIPTQIYLLNQ